MAEVRINATGGLKLYDADDSHYAQILAGTISSNVDALTLGSSSADFNIPVKVLGTTPTLTIGDAGAEDTKIVFDGNAKDFYVALDDSADKLVIGEGSTVGTNSILTITDDSVTIGDAAAVDTKIVFDGNAQDYHIGLDDSADTLVLGLGSTLGTTPAMTVNSSQVVTFAQNPVFPDGGVAVADLDIDGATDIGADIVDADLFIVDDGAGGTNRKTAASRLKTYVGGGITTASMWRLTTGFSGNADPIASNWEVQDNSSYGSLGSAMAESSGIFTFPSTGFWYVQFYYYTQNTSADNHYTEGMIQATTNNSSYETVASNAQGTANDQSEYGVGVCSTMLDLTNTSNFKVKFKIGMQNTNSSVLGSTNNNATHVLFLRLGDT